MMVRPAPKREAFLRLDPLVGEQAQIDWAHVGQVAVPGGGSRSLWLFVMVLAWSRAMWGEFCFDTTVHSLLRSLVRTSSYLGGSARQWLFDNPKIVVLERHGAAARFHPLLLDLSSALHVPPPPPGPDLRPRNVALIGVGAAFGLALIVAAVVGIRRRMS